MPVNDSRYKDGHMDIHDYIACEVCHDERQVEGQLTHVVRRIGLVTDDEEIYDFKLNDDWEIMPCPFCSNENND